MVHKSIIENIELKSGTEVYVQGSTNRIVISFDGQESSYNITLTKSEAEAFQEILDKVMNEVSV